MQKTVLILGASGGIGSACAKLFAQAGYACALQYRTNAQAVQALAAEFDDIHPIAADLTDAAQARRCVSLAAYHLGHIDSIVYCAGTAKQEAFSALEDEDFLAMYEVHVLGAVRVIRAALDELMQAQSPSVVLFSSMWGQVGAAGESHYAAAKGAVIALCKSLAKELAVYNIRVNCVSPGLIDTPMNSNMFTEDDLAPVIDRTPMNRAGTPEEAAACALFLCDEKASFITGQVLSPNGGIC